MKKALLALAVVCLLALPLAAETGSLLPRSPAVSTTEIAFVYAGDLWLVSREGGQARRLTTGRGAEHHPAFSPDGRSLAFDGEYDGNVDIFVVPVTGGVPRRLTWHPGDDVAVGWTRDGKEVIFRSDRASGTDDRHLYTVPLEGGWPRQIPLPAAEEGSLSPDGSRLAYVPHQQWQEAWKRYRGGQTTPIWIVDLDDFELEEVPRDNSNDGNPMWVDDTVYFLSDRDGPVTLYAYDTRSKEVRRVIDNGGLDLKSAAAGPGAIVYEQFGSLHLLDLATGEPRPVAIELDADLLDVRPRYEKVAEGIQSAGLSPSGKRALFEARGEIFTVPAEKGSIRNLTRSPGAADRSPAWSPDGRWVAYLSDASGEYALHLVDQSGRGEARAIPLGEPPSFFYSPVWSPDGKKIALHDKRLILWIVDVLSGELTRVDQDLYEEPIRRLDPAWSPDSRFLAYTKNLPNHLRAVFVYALDDATARPVSDGMSDALFPAFDGSGKYLYFTASTSEGLSPFWIDLSSVGRPTVRSVYLAVLDETLPSPLAPESDEEEVAAEEGAGDGEGGKEGKTGEEEGEGDGAKDAPPVVKIDFDGIDQRTLALPIPARNYLGLAAGKAGELFLLEGPAVGFGPDGPPQVTVQKFDLAKRKTDKLLEGIEVFALSADGEKMLVKRGQEWTIAATSAPPEAGAGRLALETMETFVDPRAEWRQMYHEAWRIQRDFLYDPGHHGLDLATAEKKYAPYLDAVAHRDDLNYLFQEMLGELTLGHVYIGGGDLPEVAEVAVGLLGADYEIDRGRYRFRRIFDGESWNPELTAPLTQPGVNVAPGEYLLAVDGREVVPPDNLYRFFQNTAGRQVVLTVGPEPSGRGSREVTVVPVPSEQGLRYRAWVEDNRRTVDRLSNGRLAYVHLPDTSLGGYTSFNRYFFAQTDREGAVIDERYNHGGFLADYVVDHLRRPLLSCMTTREGADFCSPGGAIHGPKAMLINHLAGSGGDALPWYFKKLGIGPLIGTRTWGGLVGIYDYPPLVDGGGVTAPRVAIYGLEGEWEVENVGIAPDIEIEMTPAATRGGRDPQLEKAVEILLQELEKNPPQKPVRPPYPDYHGGG